MFYSSSFGASSIFQSSWDFPFYDSYYLFIFTVTCSLDSYDFNPFYPLIVRFVPSINAIIYHGDKKERDELRRKHMPRTVGPKFPIVITSYEVVLSDARKHLRHYSWKYLVVDEVMH